MNKIRSLLVLLTYAPGPKQGSSHAYFCAGSS